MSKQAEDKVHSSTSSIIEAFNTKNSRERRAAFDKQVEDMIRSGVAPDAEYTAVAGPDYGWVKAWKIAGGYAVQYGDVNNTYADVDKSSHLEDDDLAPWLEWQDLDPLESIEQRANVRGADAIPDATGDEDGPFYILVTRYWYGPREVSGFVTDDRCDPIEFESIKDAHAWIKRADSEVCYLSHGEYARPCYKVVTA